MAARLTQQDMLTRRDQVLAYLEECAALDKACPSLGQLAARWGAGTATMDSVLKQLRAAKAISWKLVYCGTGLGNVRVVTICATGKTTATPPMATSRRGNKTIARPAFTPTENGCPVRTLEGAEFEFYKNLYEAREAEAAARRAVYG